MYAAFDACRKTPQTTRPGLSVIIPAYPEYDEAERNVFHVGVRDTQCGFKLHTSDAAAKLTVARTILGLSFDLKHLDLARKYGLRVAEMPIAWVDAPGSRVNTGKEVQRFVRDLGKIKPNDMRGVNEIA